MAFGLRFFFLKGTPGSEVGLWVLSAITVICALALARTLKPRSVYVDSFSSDNGWLILSLLASLGLLLGNGLLIFQGTSGMNTVIAYLGVVAGGSMAVVAIGRKQGTVTSLWIHAAVTIYLVVKLIFDFRNWSIDPSLMDYCFSLFAAIGAMLANTYIGHFVFNKGRRKPAVFWCLVATVFNLCAVADGTLSTRLMLIGLALWSVSNCGQLLED